MSTVEEQLRDIVSSQLGIDKDEITSNSSFIEDFNADSLTLVELKMSIEDGFHLRIPDEDMDKVITTFKEAQTYIEKHVL